MTFVNTKITSANIWMYVASNILPSEKDVISYLNMFYLPIIDTQQPSNFEHNLTWNVEVKIFNLFSRVCRFSSQLTMTSRHLRVLKVIWGRSRLYSVRVTVVSKQHIDWKQKRHEMSRTCILHKSTFPFPLTLQKNSSSIFPQFFLHWQAFDPCGVCPSMLSLVKQHTAQSKRKMQDKHSVRKKESSSPAEFETHASLC